MSEEPQNTNATSVWSQWLQYLSGQVPYGQKILVNRLESLQTIMRSVPDKITFYSRVGTMIYKSIDTKAVIVFKQKEGKKELVIASVPKQKATKIMQMLSTAPLTKKVSNLTIRKRPLLENDVYLSHGTFLNLETDNEGQITLAALNDKPLAQLDAKFIETVGDLISLKQEERSLSTSLNSQVKQNSTLIHHLSEGLMILDDNLQIRVWNRPLQRITGFSPKEAEHRAYYEILQRVGEPNWLDTLKKEFNGENVRHLFASEFQIRTKNKNLCWVNVSGSFLRGDDNKIEQIIIIIRDISRLKELENRKSEFISIATHELRTPITAIKGYLSMLEKKSENLDEKQLLYLKRATQANDRLVRLAEDLLQVVQVEENRLIFANKPLDVSEVVGKVVSDFQPRIQKKGLKITFTPPDIDTTIAADPLRFEQVISNLIDNAIKYTKIGKIYITLTRIIDRKTKLPFLIIDVKDTGLGMSDNDLVHIFDKFHRTNEAELGQESGAGLGLFIVKSFIEKQNGKISVKSRLGRGSTFTLTFPLINEQSNIIKKEAHE